MGYLKRLIEKVTQNDVFGEVKLGKYKCVIQVGSNVTAIFFYKEYKRMFFDHFADLSIDIWGPGGRRLELFSPDEKDRKVLIDTVKKIYPDVNIVLEADEVAQMFLDAEELLREGKDDECLALKDKFQSYYKKLSPNDQEEVDDILESCGA